MWECFIICEWLECDFYINAVIFKLEGLLVHFPACVNTSPSKLDVGTLYYIGWLLKSEFISIIDLDLDAVTLTLERLSNELSAYTYD